MDSSVSKFPAYEWHESGALTCAINRPGTGGKCGTPPRQTEASLV